MTASDAAFLDALAACVRSEIPLADALSRIEAAGPDAARWVRAIRPFARPENAVEDALASAGVIDAAERGLFTHAASPHRAALVQALADRRRRRHGVRTAVMRALGGPFVLAVATVLLDPIVGVVTGDSYFGPFLREAAVLAVVTAAVMVGLRWLLASASGASVRLRLATLPGIARVASVQAEGDVAALAAPFAAGPGASTLGLVAVSDVLAWSPIGLALRAAATSGGATPERALERLAPALSLETNLAVVRGIAAEELSDALRARARELATEAERVSRGLARFAGYALVVTLSLVSLAGTLARPHESSSPTLAPDEKELLDQLQNLLGDTPPARPRK
jgi:hypothetical protein